MNVSRMKTDAFGFGQIADMIGGESLSSSRYAVEERLYRAIPLLRTLYMRVDEAASASNKPHEVDPTLIQDARVILEMALEELPNPDNNAAFNEIESYEFRSVDAVRGVLVKNQALQEALKAMEVLARPDTSLRDVRAAVEWLYNHQQCLPEGEALWTRCMGIVSARGLLLEWVKVTDASPAQPSVHTEETLKHKKKADRAMATFVDVMSSAPLV